MGTNIACRVFKEQLNLINQLPEKERPIVLYIALTMGLNQIENHFDNQIENQNENAYVSVSESLYLNQLSEISKCVLELLCKNIVWKEFSNNYGGKRTGSGRKTNNQDEKQLENQDEKKIVDISTLKKWGGVGSKKPECVTITSNFNIYDLPKEKLKPFLEAYGDGMARKIQDWLRRKKAGQVIEISRILSLFYKFYQRENGQT